MKTSPKRLYSVIENERFVLVFTKTGSIISGTGLLEWFNSYFCLYFFPNILFGTCCRTSERTSTYQLFAQLSQHQVIALYNRYSTYQLSIKKKTTLIHSVSQKCLIDDFKCRICSVKIPNLFFLGSGSIFSCLATSTTPTLHKFKS